jgi:protein-tyrosine phosphatase
VETAEALSKKIKRWTQQQSAHPSDSSSYRSWQRKIEATQAKLNELCPRERAVAAYKADLVAINSQQQYLALCNSEHCDEKNPHPMSDHINVIVPGLLYLGDSVVATNRTWLVAHNIQAIVNVAEIDGVITNHEELEGRYLSFKVDDHFNAMQQIEQCFERAKEFLLQHHSQQTAVLVHCKQGISRSSTLVIAYMMHLKKWSLRQAMEVVKAARSKVAPNGGFMRALLQMEYALHGTQSMDENDFPVPLELGYDALRVHVVDPAANGERRNSLSKRRGSEHIESVNLTIDPKHGFMSFSSCGEFSAGGDERTSPHHSSSSSSSSSSSPSPSSSCSSSSSSCSCGNGKGHSGDRATHVHKSGAGSFSSSDNCCSNGNRCTSSYRSNSSWK